MDSRRPDPSVSPSSTGLPFSGAASLLCRSFLGRAPSPGRVHPCRCRCLCSRPCPDRTSEETAHVDRVMAFRSGPTPPRPVIGVSIDWAMAHGEDTPVRPPFLPPQLGQISDSAHVLFFPLCEFSYLSAVYSFAEKTFIFMHIISHKPCITCK
ncbi:hypothetical protein VPH35_020674 [Triticum aestivum]